MLAMQPDSADSTPKINRVMLFLYLVPVFGCVPALWTLYRQPDDRLADRDDGAQLGNSPRRELHREHPGPGSRGATAPDREQQVSRLAVTLGGTWLLASLLLGAGAQSTELPDVPVLVASTVVTSSYFLINLWLMVQVLRRRRIWVPGVSDLGDRLP